MDFDDFPELLLEELRDTLVTLLAGAFQQRLICRILNEGMLEDVLRARQTAALIEKLVGDQLLETTLQLWLFEPHHRTQHLVGKFASQY